MTLSHATTMLVAPTQPSNVHQDGSGFGTVWYHHNAPNPVAADFPVRTAAAQHHRNRLRHNASSEVAAARKKAAAATFGTTSLGTDSFPRSRV